MALHCGHCGSTDVLQLADTYSCLYCGLQTAYPSEPEAPKPKKKK